MDLAVNQDAREMTEQFIILTFETYGVRTGSCIIMKNWELKKNKKWGQKSLFLDKGQKSLAYEHFQLVPVNNSCSCFLQVKWQWFFLVDNIYWD